MGAGYRTAEELTKAQRLQRGLAAILALDPQASVCAGQDLVRAGDCAGPTFHADTMLALGWQWHELHECWELAL